MGLNKEEEKITLLYSDMTVYRENEDKKDQLIKNTSLPAK